MYLFYACDQQFTIKKEVHENKEASKDNKATRMKQKLLSLSGAMSTPVCNFKNIIFKCYAHNINTKSIL